MTTLPHWVVQTNFGEHSDVPHLLAALSAEGVPFTALTHRPFEPILPDLVLPKDQPVVVYGSTNLTALVAEQQPWAPGVFFDPDRFTYSAWAQHYGEALLNSPAEIVQTTLGQAATYPWAWEDVFVRPERDLKEFSGTVWTTHDFVAWSTKMAGGQYPGLGPETRIVVGPPHGIHAEWRVFVSDQGEVLGASLYRDSRGLRSVAGAPAAVLAMAQRCARQWSPAPVFVMDIAQSGDGLFIVEAQCAHSAGFYAVPLQPWIQGMNLVVERWWQTHGSRPTLDAPRR